MADYFLVHDRAVLEDQLRPALALAWRQRSFAPCLDICQAWAGPARDYAQRYHVDPNDLLLLHIEAHQPFDRLLWRTLVGELLLTAARDIPEFPNSFDSILALLAVQDVHETASRHEWPPIRQALSGSRDLTFGLAVYRPEHAGYNNAADTARLAGCLASVKTDDWKVDDFPVALGLGDEEDRQEELAFAREWFAALAEVYRRASAAGQVLVLERIF